MKMIMQDDEMNVSIFDLYIYIYIFEISINVNNSSVSTGFKRWFFFLFCLDLTPH